MTGFWAVEQATALKDLLAECGVESSLLDLIAWPTIDMDPPVWPRIDRPDVLLLMEERVAAIHYRPTPDFRFVTVV